MFTRWELYVLKSFSSDCSSPMSISILRNIPNLLDSSTGTGMPHWNMYCKSPAVCKQTDLPPALGPEIRTIRCSSLISISRGMTSLPLAFKLRYNRGCFALYHNISGRFSKTGTIAFTRMAKRAFERTKSTKAMKSYAGIKSSI